jgi:hypothetical protein
LRFDLNRLLKVANFIRNIKQKTIEAHKQPFAETNVVLFNQMGIGKKAGLFDQWH